MKNSFVFAGIICLFLAAQAFAQSEIISKADKEAITDISALIKKAIDAKDTKALEQLYSADFVHIHAAGKLNDRTARLSALVSGEPTIDSKGVEGFNLRKYGNTIIATGKIAMTDDAGNPVVYSVTRVFSKTGTKWQLVSSHASKIEE